MGILGKLMKKLAPKSASTTAKDQVIPSGSLVVDAPTVTTNGSRNSTATNPSNSNAHGPETTTSTWKWLKRRQSASTEVTTANPPSTISRMSTVKGLISMALPMTRKKLGGPADKEAQAQASTPSTEQHTGKRPSEDSSKATTAKKNVSSNVLDTPENAKLPSTTQTRSAFLSSFGYILEKDVDSGAFANVYLVRSKNENETKSKPYAVKRINLLAKSNKKFINKFLPREIWSHAQIRHGCLIRYFKTLVAFSDIYMVMEWVPRGNMLDYCRLRGRVPDMDAARITYQLCSGLAYMHINNMCHRDIKCENILMHSVEPIHIKIADFGFAKFIGPNAATMNPEVGICLNTLATRTNNCLGLSNEFKASNPDTIRSTSTENQGDYLTRTFCGSLAYSAPELIMGKMYDGRRVDSWSAGCVLFIMLTHRMAFREKMGNRALVQQQLAGVRWPQSCEDLISPNAKDLVETILEFQYVKRPFTDEILNHKWFDDIREEQERDISLWNNTRSGLSVTKSRRRSVSLNALTDSQFKTYSTGSRKSK